MQDYGPSWYWTAAVRERQARIARQRERRQLRQMRLDALAIAVIICAMALGAVLAKWFEAPGGM